MVNNNSSPAVYQGLVIYPGDHLLVVVPWGTSAEFTQEIKNRMQDRHTDIDVTVLTASQLAVIRRQP